MKIVKCKKCGNEYPRKMKRCPECRKKAPVSTGRKIAGIFLCIVGVMGLFYSAINWEETPTSSSSTPAVSSQESETKGKVNYENFEKIENGMTYEQVVEIFGQEGKIMTETDAGLGEEYKTTIYYWYDKTGIANCNVTIQGGKVVGKAQAGLR